MHWPWTRVYVLYKSLNICIASRFKSTVLIIVIFTLLLLFLSVASNNTVMAAMIHPWHQWYILGTNDTSVAPIYIPRTNDTYMAPMIHPWHQRYIRSTNDIRDSNDTSVAPMIHPMRRCMSSFQPDFITVALAPMINYRHNDWWLSRPCVGSRTNTYLGFILTCYAGLNYWLLLNLYLILDNEKYVEFNKI